MKQLERTRDDANATIDHCCNHKCHHVFDSLLYQKVAIGVYKLIHNLDKENHKNCLNFIHYEEQ